MVLLGNVDDPLGFNEATAVRPWKDASGGAIRDTRMRFNEATAVRAVENELGQSATPTPRVLQ